MSKKLINLDSFLRKSRNFVVKIIPENSKIFNLFFVLGLKMMAKKRQKKRENMKFLIPVTEHCNLNCKCCTSFSPIAQPIFLDVENYNKDLHNLSKIIKDKIDSIWLTGGEPLLHTQIEKIIDLTRFYFKTANIGLLSNGILLPKMPDEFWENCNKNNVAVYITRYPIKLNFNEIKQKANKFGVQFDYLGGQNEAIKTMWKYPLDLDGKTPLKSSYGICSQINDCTKIRNGKLFPCNTIAGVENFNHFFDKNLKISENDYLEIDKIKLLDEIFDFLCTPKPFCRYCNRRGVKTGIAWAVTTKNINEWT